MPRPGITADTLRSYARGYLLLDLHDQALAELDQLTPEELGETTSLDLLLDIEMERKAWTHAVDISRELNARDPRQEKPWISWAYSLRELQRVEEARDLLLKAEPLLGRRSALLHYNLACYYSLLSDLPECRRRLARAIKLHPPFEKEALSDPDLENLRKSSV